VEEYFFFFFFFFLEWGRWVDLLYLATIDMLCKKIKSAYLGQLRVSSGYGRAKYV